MVIDLSRVLITGANGMVGSYADFGIKTDHGLLDVTNLKTVLEFCKREKPLAILHLAADTDVVHCEQEPEHAYLVNAIGTYNMAIAARSLGVKLVYISTSGIFDGKKESPYVESDDGNPKNYYGHSKYLGELAVRGMLKDYMILRTSWIFGGGQLKDKKFVATIIKKLDDPEIKVANDSLGSPTFGKDIITAVKKLLKEDAVGIVNLANEGVCSRYDVALEIAAVLASRTKIIPVSLSYFKSDIFIGLNQSLTTRADLMRPWKEALREYLELEWKEVSDNY